MGINAVDLQKRLSSDPELIIKVLIKLGFHEDKIVWHKNKGMITSVRPEENADNPHGFICFTDSTRYMFTTRSGNGNLFSLVMDMKQVSFPEALQMIASWIGYNGTVTIPIVRPFGGFYKRLTQNEDMLDTDLPIYDESNLPDVSVGVSKMFLDDHIALDVQEMFGDRFDHENNAILIPIRNSNGELVGIKSRNNEKNPEDGRRYWAALPFQKTHVVYGLNVNYQNIINKDTVIICESEKAVQQAWSFGCKIVVSVMGHQISKVQAKILKSLMVKKYIVAFDEGLSETEIKQQAKQLQLSVPFFENQVFYTFGGLEKGSKNSPTDCGVDVFQNIMKNYLVRLDSGKSK